MRSSTLLCAVVLALCIFSFAVASSIDPIVIVPGLSASALRNIEVDPLFARRWINLVQLGDDSYKSHLECFWNQTAGRLESAETILPYPDEEGVINLTGIPGIETEFHDLIKAIRSSSGGFRAVPYDWRLVPQQNVMETFVTEMESAISDLYGIYKKPVRIVAHSLGNLMTLYYLNWQYQTNATVITERIAGYVGVSPPYAGAGLGLQAVTYGVEEVFEKFDIDNHTILTFGKHIPQDFLGNFASFPWVFPQQRAFDFPVVVYGNSASYTPDQIPNFLASSYPFDNDALEIYNNVILKFDPALYTNLPAGLTQDQITLIVSTYNATCVGIKYTSTNGQYHWSEITENINDPTQWGDGTVPHASLHANDNLWQVTPIIITGVSHSGIIKDPRFISNIIELSSGFSLPGTV